MSPTYLYIKQHSITGLKYFGKTTVEDPYKYSGSGKYWKSHIKKHGRKHILNLLVVGPYRNEDELKTLAMWMSEEMNIVSSPEWANLIPENGVDASPLGLANKNPSKEIREKMRVGHLGKILSDEHRENMRISGTLAWKSRPRTFETIRISCLICKNTYKNHTFPRHCCRPKRLGPRTLSEEHRKHLSESKKAYYLSKK